MFIKKTTSTLSPHVVPARLERAPKRQRQAAGVRHAISVCALSIFAILLAISSYAYDINWIVDSGESVQTIPGSIGTVRWTGFDGAEQTSLIIDNSEPVLIPSSVTLTYSFIQMYTYPSADNYSADSLMNAFLSDLRAGNYDKHSFYLGYIGTRLSGLINYGDGSHSTYVDSGAVLTISEDSIIVAEGSNAYIGDYDDFLSAPGSSSGLSYQFKTNVVISVPVAGIESMQFDFSPYDFGSAKSSVASGFRFRGNGDLSELVYTTQQTEMLRSITLILSATQSDVSELLSIINAQLPTISDNITVISADIAGIKQLIVNPIIPTLSNINSNSKAINNFLQGDFFEWEKENAKEINSHLVNIEEYCEKVIQSLGLDDDESKEASEKILNSIEASEGNVVGGYNVILDEFGSKVDYTTLEVLNEYYFKSGYPQKAGLVFFDAIDSYNFVAGTLGVITLFLNYAIIFSLLRIF